MQPSPPSCSPPARAPSPWGKPTGSQRARETLCLESLLVTPQRRGRVGSGCCPARMYIARSFIKARVGPEGVIMNEGLPAQAAEQNTPRCSRGRSVCAGVERPAKGHYRGKQGTGQGMWFSAQLHVSTHQEAEDMRHQC